MSTWHYRFVINTYKEQDCESPIEVYEVYDLGYEKCRTNDPKDPLNFWIDRTTENSEEQVSRTLSNLQKSLEKFGIVTLEELDKELNMK